MGRPKGSTSKNRTWSKENKLVIVKMILEDNKTLLEVSKEFNVSTGMTHQWVKTYINLGEEGLEIKKKPGSIMAKYYRRKKLTDLEQLEFENLKLKIENERLKKGYLVKGVGKDKEFIPINKENMK